MTDDPASYPRHRFPAEVPQKTRRPAQALLHLRLGGLGVVIDTASRAGHAQAHWARHSRVHSGTSGPIRGQPQLDRIYQPLPRRAPKYPCPAHQLIVLLRTPDHHLAYAERSEHDRTNAWRHIRKHPIPHDRFTLCVHNSAAESRRSNGYDSPAAFDSPRDHTNAKATHEGGAIVSRSPRTTVTRVRG